MANGSGGGGRGGEEPGEEEEEEEEAMLLGAVKELAEEVTWNCHPFFLFLFFGIHIWTIFLKKIIFLFFHIYPYIYILIIPLIFIIT